MLYEFIFNSIQYSSLRWNQKSSLELSLPVCGNLALTNFHLDALSELLHKVLPQTIAPKIWCWYY